MEFKHYSVMLNECIDGLNIKPDGIYVDGTMGGAGHSSVIASMLSPKGHLVCIDQDEDAIKAGSERLKDYSDRVDIVRSNFSDTKTVLNNLNITGIKRKQPRRTSTMNWVLPSTCS